MWNRACTKTAVFGAVLLLGAADDVTTQSNGYPVLYGLELTTRAVVVEVISNGCTAAADFRVEVAATDAAPAITIRRLREDVCRMAPHIITLELSLPEGDEITGTGKEYTLVNKLAFPDARVRRR